MSRPAILTDLFNVIFSRGSVAGATPCASPDGPRTDLFGRAVARANLSAQPVLGGALPTSAISGPPGSTLSASAGLTLSLVNRLKQRLTTDGSTLFNLTWREKVTPAGRLVYRLAASARRTSDSDSGSWQTPKALDGVFSTPRTTGRPMHRATHLQTQTIALLTNADPTLASWASPRAQDGERGGSMSEALKWAAGAPRPSGAQRGTSLTEQTQLIASWPTPQTRDNKNGWDEKALNPHNKPYSKDLNDFALLASWPTTSTRDYKGGYRGGAHEERQDQPRRIGCGGAANFWSDCDWLPCRDGKARPVEPGTFPLAHGISGRVGRLRAYGNAIVPQVAQVFIEAYLES